jgi:hypothetical protein
MGTFDTYRVRLCETRALAINVSARSAEGACELALRIREELGQGPFEAIDDATENVEAQLLDTSESPWPPTRLPAGRRQMQAGAA